MFASRKYKQINRHTVLLGRVQASDGPPSTDLPDGSPTFGWTRSDSGISMGISTTSEN